MAVSRGCHMSCGHEHAWSRIAFFSHEGPASAHGHCVADPQTSYEMVFSVKLTNIKLEQAGAFVLIWSCGCWMLIDRPSSIPPFAGLA
jgi:hypothetical protein